MGEGQEGQSGFHGFKAEAGPASLGSDDDGDLSPPPDGADASAAATAGRTDPARQRVRGAPAQGGRSRSGPRRAAALDRRVDRPADAARRSRREPAPYGRAAGAAVTGTAAAPPPPRPGAGAGSAPRQTTKHNHEHTSPR